MTAHGKWTGIGRSDPLSQRDLKRLGITRHWWQKTLYQYQADPDNPLTYRDVSGAFYRPIDGIIHDFGSIPRVFQIFPCFNSDRYADSYVVHDCCYEPSFGHSILRSFDGVHFDRVRISRNFSDRLLFEMVLAQGARKGTACAIYEGVHLFGRFVWKPTIKQEQGI